MLRPSTISQFRLLIWVGLTLLSLEAVSPSSAQAQTVVADPSLGSQVNLNQDGFRISGGSLQGVNLFHSFEAFSPGAASVLFDLTDPSSGMDSNGVERIFSRVTGSEASFINGLLGIQGGNAPDLFFLNPNGILFGPDAQLQLAGSFLGTTAEAIQFSDHQRFRAELNGAGASSLLSMSAPMGLQLGQGSGAIEVQGAGHQRKVGQLGLILSSLQSPAEAQGLRVSAGNTLALVGNEIVLDGGILQAELILEPPVFAPGIRLPLGGVQLSLGSVSEGTVQLQPSLFHGFQLDYSDVEEYGDIRLSNRSLFDVSGLLPGRGELRGKNITIEDASLLALNSLGTQADTNGLTISASEDLSIISRNPDIPFASALLNQTLGTGQGEDINISANNLLLEGGAIVTSTFGTAGGNSGDINLLVNQDIELQGAEIELFLESLASSAAISSSSLGTGDGGMINVRSRNLVLSSGGNILSSSVGVPQQTQASGSGNGGEINLDVQELVEIRGFDSRLTLPSGINSSSVTTGDAGNIRISTQRLQISEGGIVQADSFSRGDAGDISIRASESIELSGVSNNALSSPSQISSSVVNGSIPELNEVFGLTGIRPSGDGGSVSLETRSLSVQDRARVSVINQGAGDVDQLEIRANDIFLDDQAQIIATTNTTVEELVSEASDSLVEVVDASDFNIILDASNSLILRNGSKVSASADGARNGGNILIEANKLIAIPQENSDIRANAAQSSGGNIRLNTTSTLGIAVRPQPTEQSDITASGAQFSGTVELTQTQTRSNERLTPLSSRFVDQSDRLAQSCNFNGSQLAVTGRGSLPQASSEAQTRAQQYGEQGHDYEQQQQWKLAEQNSIQALQLSQAAQNPFQTYQWAWQLARIAQARWDETGNSQFRVEAIAYYQESLAALKELRSDLAQRDQQAEFSFRTNIEPVYRDLVSLLLHADQQQQPTQAELKTSLQVIEALRLAELDDFFDDACSTATANSIEQLDPTAAVVYPIILGDRLEVVVSLPDGTLHRHSSLLASDEVNQLTWQFRQALVTRSRRSYRAPGKRLYDLLIQPALEHLNQAEIETLVLVPDGSFKNIPLAALWTGDSFLIEEFNVANAPGLELLDAQPSDAISREAITAGIAQQRDFFAALPYVQQELAGIQQLIPGESFLDEQFTGEALQQALLEKSAPIVHIATHGQFSSTVAETFILAWDERIDSNQLGELLRSREQSQTPTELLVLSACETASGDEAAALGLAGLAVRAGARSTLASLWSINDSSTAALMQEFYSQLSQQSASKSLALRQAQLAMLEDSIYSHPYYWSAFVLLGDWQ